MYEIVGQSAPHQHLMEAVRRLAQLPMPVLVVGETGVGKELVARALGAGRPFVPVNCGALPRDLLEAELFGAAAGAFTGAIDRRGLVRSADGGTLFLDEIGELPPTAQAALLRVLEAKVVRPVGSDREFHVDFRLVAATHRDLGAMVDAGTFRADLYHRISGVVLQVPALRERRSDIRPIALALRPGLADRMLPAAWTALETYDWPGNVRQLRNVLDRVAFMTDGRIGLDDLHLPTVTAPLPATASRQPLRARIAGIVRAELDAQNGNARAAARALGISPTTLYRHLAMR